MASQITIEKKLSYNKILYQREPPKTLFTKKDSTLSLFIKSFISKNSKQSNYFPLLITL